MNIGVRVLLMALLQMTAWAQEIQELPQDHDQTNQSGPNSRGIFSSPTGGILRNGDDEGFGLGPVLPDPTSFQGTGRQECVLQGSRYVDNLGITGHYGIYIDSHQRLMFTASAGTSVGGLDIDYSFIPEETDGYFSLYLNQTCSHNGAYLHLPRNQEGFTKRSQPWLFRTSTGVGYTTDPSQNFTLSLGTVFEHLSLRDGPVGGFITPRDRTGQPLTVSPGGADDLLFIRASGLLLEIDHLQFPTAGEKFRFQAEQAIPVGATQARFTRLNVNFTHFQPLQLWGEEPQTLICNFQGGSALGVLPPYESYNLGGIDSVRGYQLGEIGGGRTFVQCSLELRAPLGSLDFFGAKIPLRFTAFADAGGAFGSASQVLGLPGLVRDKPNSGLGYGLGVQALSELGLIRLEGALAAQGRHQVMFVIGDRY